VKVVKIHHWILLEITRAGTHKVPSNKNKLHLKKVKIIYFQITKYVEDYIEERIITRRRFCFDFCFIYCSWRKN
jgi:hypothetical protein